MDANGVLASAYDSTTNTLRLVVVGAQQDTTNRQEDDNGVWASVFDSTNQAIRIVV